MLHELPAAGTVSRAIPTQGCLRGIYVASNIALRGMSPHAWTRGARYDESLSLLPCPREEVHEANLLRTSIPHAFPLGRLLAIVLITEEITFFV